MDINLEELRSLLCANTGTPVIAPAAAETRQIVIADRGWVFVGFVTEQRDGSLSLRDASTVRVWGTTKGLGQLALEGPQPNTKLDPCGAVTVPASAVVARMACGGVWR